MAIIICTLLAKFFVDFSSVMHKFDHRECQQKKQEESNIERSVQDKPCSLYDVGLKFPQWLLTECFPDQI